MTTARQSHAQLDAALDYAGRGWRVVPLHEVLPGADGRPGCSCGRSGCESQGKHPRVGSWPRAATTDAEAVRKWWARWPTANVGVALGTGSGLVSIDVDPPSGEEFLAGLAGGDLPATLEMRTGKGRRLLYAIPDGVDADPQQAVYKDAAGLEAVRLQSTGGQCVMPPSLHPNGRRYAWARGRGPADLEPAPMPAWMLAEMVRPPEPVWSDQAARDVFAEGADFNRAAEWWGEILEPAGAARFGKRGDVEYVTRPGKKGGVSATLGHYRATDGTPALYVFSGNWTGLEPQRCYDKFGAFARLHCGGDYSRAAKVLAGRGYARRGRPPGGKPGANGHRRAGGAGAGTTPGAEGHAADRPSNPLPLLYFSDLAPSVDTADFVEGLLVRGGMSVIYGESNTGKTFFALDLALHVAAGMTWRDREVDRGGVLYLALEGKHGIRNRVAAFKAAADWHNPGLPFAVVPVALNLLDPAADTARVIDAVKTAAARMGVDVSLVVVDTLSRAMSGGNENSPEDMGALVMNADRIREAVGAHVQFIHHSGKDAARGARGHSSLRAATDTEIEVTHDRVARVSVARVAKQRELECGGEFAFRLEPVVLGQNRRSKPVTSCVVVPTDVPPRSASGLPKGAQEALDVLAGVLAEHGKTGYGAPDGVRSVLAEWWRDRLYRSMPNANQEARKKAFQRAVTNLTAAGRVCVEGDRAWIITPGGA